jgi:hypothetical protein
MAERIILLLINFVLALPSDKFTKKFINRSCFRENMALDGILSKDDPENVSYLLEATLKLVSALSRLNPTKDSVATQQKIEEICREEFKTPNVEIIPPEKVRHRFTGEQEIVYQSLR